MRTGSRPGTPSRGSSRPSSVRDGRCGENPGGNPAGLQLPLLHPDVQAFLAAPIASPAHVYGWICLVGNEGRTFTEDDEHLVMALSGQVGRVYENGYFHAIAQKRAEELEHEIVERKQAEIGPAAGTRSVAAVPGHRRDHPARPGRGRADHAGESLRLLHSRVDFGRAARAATGSDNMHSDPRGEMATTFHELIRGKSCVQRESRPHPDGRGAPDRMAQHGAA